MSLSEMEGIFFNGFNICFKQNYPFPTHEIIAKGVYIYGVGQLHRLKSNYQMQILLLTIYD